jgi:cysteine synthase A
MRLLDTVGGTPLIKITDKIYAKLETYNPSGSIKDRMASYILQCAEKRGDIKKGDTIIEASSGNTGIAFSMLGAAKGYEVIIIMPSNMSDERKQMIKSFGAKLMEVAPGDFKGAIALRDDLVAKNDNYWTPDQFANEDNVACHQATTAMEILTDSYKQNIWPISALVSGAGTGGTIMGCRLTLKSDFKNMKTILVIPDRTEGTTHGIQGIGDDGDYLVNRSVIDEVIEITTSEATERARRLIREQGLLVGISSGANILAAERWVAKNNPEGIVVTFLCDRGERYLSIKDS